VKIWIGIFGGLGVVVLLYGLIKLHSTPEVGDINAPIAITTAAGSGGLAPSSDPTAITTDTPTPEVTATDTPIPTDTPSDTPTETPTFSPTPSVTFTPTPGTTATPTPRATTSPDPSTTKVIMTLDRSQTACGSEDLRFVAAGEGAKYQQGLSYSALALGSTSSLSVPATETTAVVYIINPSNEPCLVGYQRPGTASFTLNRVSTGEVIAYPDMSGVSIYQLNERVRRLHAMTSFTDLDWYLDGALKDTTLSVLSTRSAYLDRIQATTAQYDSLYPGSF
jgi:hypothetical protein